MEFRTEITVPQGLRGLIRHGEQIWTVGSCFSDTIGGRLARDLFLVESNPYGTVFNPLTVARLLSGTLSGELLRSDRLFCHDGMWHHPDLHSSFSSVERGRLLSSVNATVDRLRRELPSLRTLMLTFGSSRVFIDRETGCPVGNCHKLPASRFETVDLTAAETFTTVRDLVTELRKVAPQMQVVLTVSPVRHRAYGLHTDKLSKANLLVACDMLTRELSDCHYFPAYEILMDDLRDYRFYAADMVHPTEQAADYVYCRFRECFFDEGTADVAARAGKLTRRLSHLPMTDNVDAFLKFKLKTDEAFREFIKECPATAAVARRYLNDFNKKSK